MLNRNIAECPCCGYITIPNNGVALAYSRSDRQKLYSSKIDLKVKIAHCSDNVFR